MNIYGIPVIGWLIGLIVQIAMAIPFYYAWNYVAPKYFIRWLHPEWLQLPFWDIVALFVAISIIKAVLVPRWGSTVTVEGNRDGKK